MLTLYCRHTQTIAARNWTGDSPIPDDTLWLDLYLPTKEEESAVEAFLGAEIPTREEMHEIEISNRLYQENGTQFMTATIVTVANQPQPETHAVTFVLHKKALVTIRYAESLAFQTYAAYVQRQLVVSGEGKELFAGLLDSIVNRLADIIEATGTEMEQIGHHIFRREQQKESRSLQQVLTETGRAGDVLSKTYESLMTLGRLAAFALKNSSNGHDELIVIQQDISGLIDHTVYLTNKSNFLLDATLGMVSIQQNNVFRVLSIASLIFMPPTLVAGIYGMNFHVMPELSWHYGYPLALVVIVVSAVLPLAYLKRKKYL